MKISRRDAIVRMIQKQPVETQEELAALLREEGFSVTQATVSRDIKALALTKILTPQNTYRYALPSASEPEKRNENFQSILSKVVLSIQSAYNQIVIKTVTASADIATEMIDRMEWPEVLGSIAGENTILLIIRTIDEVPQVVERLNQLIHKYNSPESE